MLLRRVDRHLFRNARRVGAATAARKLQQQMWHTTVNLVLRCDLTSLPDVPPSRVDVRMAATQPTAFDGFRKELQVARGADFVEAYARNTMCADGVRTLYVSEAPDGSPIFAQWLIGADDQPALDAHAPGRYQPLADGEFIVDGAYTFVAHRGKGAMTTGMAQLLRIARERGGRSAITFVAADNVASLRGCAAVGFGVHEQRFDVRRLGTRRYSFGALDVRGRDAWDAAVAPRLAS